MAKLAADKLTLAYDQQEIIRDLGISIPEGKVTALVGPNGCGKSTLLRGLARLMAPKAGNVLLDGKAIARLSSKEVARQMGILPQGPVAPEGMSVRELVTQGRYPHQSLLRQWSKEDEDALEWALDITSLVELADRPLDTLSGGQRQRAWIAMTLAQQTPVLLLDEPTTFLDLAHQVEILSLLDELNEREGRTIVMVLHDINQACRYAHHIVALRDGAVVAEGDPREVVDHGMVCQVFGIECHVVRDPVSGTPLCLPQSCPLRLLPKTGAA
ncbi:MAG TPA: ABC transporter ATP-binding protein [Trueperaceae bacterium]